MGPEIYRSVSRAHALDDSQLYRTGESVRPPLNVPNLVDNLWEWARPNRFPTRRYSVFASPTPELAKRQGPSEGLIYRIELAGRYTMCQLKGYENSKDHPECITLPKFLYRSLGSDWLSESLDKKSEVGRLWIPCLTKMEIEDLLGRVDVLRPVRAQLADEVRYWDAVRLIDHTRPKLDPRGEIFFEAQEGYRPHSVEASLL